MALLPSLGFDPYSEVTQAEATTAVNTGLYGDEAVIKLVCSDTVKAENFENQKQWVAGWAQASVLYQSPYTARYWEGTQVERASVPMFTVAQATNALVPQVVNGLFSENPPFMIQQRPGTHAQAARAIGDILAYQLETVGSLVGNQHNTFREELRLGAVNAILFGTSIWKYGWETHEQDRTMFRRKSKTVVLKNPLSAIGGQDVELDDDDEEIEQITVTEQVDRPSFEHIVNLRHVLVDPGLNVPDIRAAKYVIHRQYLTFDQLDKLRGRPGFSVPTKEQLLSLFFAPAEQPDASQPEMSERSPLWDIRAEPRYEDTTADPLSKPLEVLERWDKGRCMMVLQKKWVLCNDENPYGAIPFFSVNWWDVPEAFWGMGLAKTIGSEQRIQQGLNNAWIDLAALTLNPIVLRVIGKNLQTQNIRLNPGKIVNVEDSTHFSFMKRADAVPEAGLQMGLSQARVEQISGANDISSQGIAGQSGHSNLARSASGANLLASGASNKISDFVEKLANQVMVPFLYAAHELDRALLPIKTIKHVLSEELQHKYMDDERDEQSGEVVRKGGDMEELLNAEVKFSILAAAKMQARRNMAQALPILVQFLTSPEFTQGLAAQKLKIDHRAVLQMFFMVSDWKNEDDVIVPMTDQDWQRFQQLQNGQQNGKAQQAAQLEQQKFQQKQLLLDQENEGKAARDVLRHAFEQSANPIETTGASGGVGFGSES